MYADSSLERPRNSLTAANFPTLLLQTCFLLLTHGHNPSIVCLHASITALGVALLFLLKTSRITMRIRIDPIDDSPGRSLVVDPQFVAAATNRGHRSGMRHSQRFALLQLPKQIARFQSGRLGEWRSLNLSFQPDQRFIGRRHHQLNCMSDLTLPSTGESAHLSPPQPGAAADGPSRTA